MIQKLIFATFSLLILSENLVEAQYYNLSQYPGELCNSKCVRGQNRLCYFQWTLELYHAMGPACGQCEQGVFADCSNPQCIMGDGFQKGVMSINRMIPGPAIHVCKGDLVIVDVINSAHGTAAAIHWHGLHMRQTPYMDGVPYGTQCPIMFESTFRYQFYATEPGTHFYHSHSGHHKLNGQYGALIVREPAASNPHIDEYDYDLPEHYVLISDWRHEYAENSFPGLPKGVSFPESILLNGWGTHVDRNTFKRNKVPCKIFYFKVGYSYRIRLINSITLTDTVQVQIQSHTMRVIATDSYNVEPFVVDTLDINSGERYDVLIDTNQRKGDYWLRVRDNNYFQPQPAESFILIRYVTSYSDYNKPLPPYPNYNDTYPLGYRLNYRDATCFDSDKDYCAADLNALVKDTDLLTAKPDYKLILSFYNNVFAVDYSHGKYQIYDNPEGNVTANGIINGISHIFTAHPILTQYYDVDKTKFCEKSECPEKCGGEQIRKCIHIQKIKLNSIVELIIYDQVNVEGLAHPFHMHGHNFVVMGMTNKTSNLTKAMEDAGRYRNTSQPWKDTITVPTNGLVVTRFNASNPGVWLLHCHYELHLATGMGLLFLVGEPSEWVQAPKDFPKCGNYMPEIRKPGY